MTYSGWEASSPIPCPPFPECSLDECQLSGHTYISSCSLIRDGASLSPDLPHLFSDLLSAISRPGLAPGLTVSLVMRMWEGFHPLDPFGASPALQSSSLRSQFLEPQRIPRPVPPSSSTCPSEPVCWGGLHRRKLSVKVFLGVWLGTRQACLLLLLITEAKWGAHLGAKST